MTQIIAILKNHKHRRLLRALDKSEIPFFVAHNFEEFADHRRVAKHEPILIVCDSLCLPPLRALLPDTKTPFLAVHPGKTMPEFFGKGLEIVHVISNATSPETRLSDSIRLVLAAYNSLIAAHTKITKRSFQEALENVREKKVEPCRRVTTRKKLSDLYRLKGPK